jgi:polyhydroxybutyrate depolymerase
MPILIWPSIAKRSVRTLLLAFLFFIVLSGCVDTSSSPGNHFLTLEHEGLTRHYLVHIPSSYDSKVSTPLVVALHGGGGDAEGSPHYFMLNQKSDEEGFIVAYPEGTGPTFLGKTFGTWNAWRCCNPAQEKKVDDVSFIREMIVKMGKEFNIDPARVYITGMSNGAQMTFRLSCELSDLVAAVAPSGSIDFSNDCISRPVPIIYFQGTADQCSPWEGGTCGTCLADFFNEIGLPGEPNPRTCSPIEEDVEKWRIRNGCSPERDITFQHEDATCYTYENCAADFTFCKVENMGHTWAGRDYYSAPSCQANPDGKICTAWKKVEEPLNTSISANDAMWDFFKNHPLSSGKGIDES